jgi:predicted NBD/HSP70 family sugar kinase
MSDSKTKRSPLGQNRENLRQHNLSVVLRLLHESGSVPRSHLTSVTGLNRSTISDLVGELVDLGLASESEAQIVGSVGRPSLTVQASKNVVAFSVNPAIDAITVGVVSFTGEVVKRVRYKTQLRPDPQTAASIAAGIIADLRAELDPETLISGIGTAVPGQIRVRDGVVRLASHLGWVEAPFGTMLQQLTGLPVYVDNDATNACVAERLYGAGRGYSNAVFLFASSGGIGGGIVAEDRLLRGAAGYAGELGHVQISASREADYAGFTGTLEALVKRDDLLYAFHLDTATDEELDVLISKATANRLVRLINQQVDHLGRAIGVLATIFNPQTVILSGFLKSIFNFNQERLLSQVRANSMQSVNEALVIKIGELGTSAPLIGAAELAFQNVLDNPADTELVINRK